MQLRCWFEVQARPCRSVFIDRLIVIRATLLKSRPLYRPEAILAVAERMKRFIALLGVLGSSQNRVTSRRTRQSIFALSAALIAAVAVAVVGARASEPLDHPSGIKFGQSIEPPPLLLRPLAKSTAIALNESIAFSKDIRYPAEPFRFSGDPSAHERAIQCLTTAIYYEAASEGPQGEQAVAQVILNRVRSPSFPASICSVVYQGSLLKTGCQFSFTCDGSLQRTLWKPEWLRAREVAEAALNGAVMPQVGLSTHYHTIDVVPYWATSLAKEVQVGRHIFYAWPGSWGQPKAFRQRYAGNEPDPAALRDTALVAKGIWPAPMESAVLPEIQVVSDPKLEAAAIVELLGRTPASEPSSFETAARAHFQPSAIVSTDKLAFDAEGSDSSVTAAEAGTDLEDLAASSRMREFLRAHRRDYKAAAVRAEQSLQRLAADWQTYTGSAMGTQRVNLRLSDSLTEPRCMAPSTGASASPTIQTADYELFIASGLPNSLATTAPRARSGDSQTLAKLIEAARTDIVFAVFARIAAISSGAEDQALVLRRAAAEGHTLASTFAKRLEAFESDRARYPTLNDFLPQLLTGLRLEELNNRPAIDDTPSSCGWLAPVSTASADVHDRPVALTASRDARP